MAARSSRPETPPWWRSSRTWLPVAVFGLTLAAISLGLASCGKGDFDNGFDESRNEPVINPGGNWSNTPGPSASPLPCPSTSPSPTPSPWPTPSASPHPSPSPTPSPHKESEWCKLFPWWPGCKSKSADVISLTDFTQPNCGSSPVPTPPHPTNYCQVDANGNPTSADQVFAQQDGDPVHSGGGGCIARSITDTWGTFFNDPLMKPDDVDTYTSTPRPDLADPTQRIAFAFDLFNQKNVPLINPDWTVRWYHAIPYGDFATPNEIAINFEKVSGTGYIQELKGGYVLDRVTDSVTSFVMDQYVNATQYGTDEANHDVVRAFQRVRTGTPMLPAQPQADVPDNSN